MLVLGLDFETTGLDTEKDSIIEIGAVLWDAKAKTPVRIGSMFINWLPQVTLTDEIVRLTGITDSFLENFGAEPASTLQDLINEIKNVPFVIAHNGTNFDKPILASNLKRCGLDMPETKWIDSSVDVPYPPHITTRKLVHLAAEHGFLNPFAHRATFDVLTMLMVVSKYDIEEIAATAAIPSVTLQAVVGFAEKDAAKSRGFRWNKASGQWVKTVKENKIEEEMRSYPFRVQRI